MTSSIWSTLLASAAATVQPVAAESADQREKWEQAQQADHQYRTQSFNEFGFVPIEEMQDGSREVRRAIVREPYGMSFMPGIEIERRPDGRARMRLQYWAWRTEWAPLGAAAWNELAALETSAFAPRPFKARRRFEGVCHGWQADLQSSSGRTSGWSQCGGDPADPALRYALKLVEFAMATRPDCERKEDPLRAFERCFEFKSKLSDPKLETEYAALRESFGRKGGADLLMNARSAVQQSGLTVGTPPWLSARAAVLAFGQHVRRNDALFQKLRELNFRARNASPGDRAILKQAIEGWRDYQA